MDDVSAGWEGDRQDDMLWHQCHLKVHRKSCGRCGNRSSTKHRKMRRSLLVLLALVASPSVVAREGDYSAQHATINPIRRVVSMLQTMQNKVEAEGVKEKELFDKFMCWCQTGGADLKKSIEAAETKIPQLESQIEEVGAEKVQLAADVKQHRSDRDAAKQAMAEATAIREKDAAAFEKESSEDKSNIDAMAGAIAALEKGMAGSFLQTTAAAVLRKLTMTIDFLDDEDREAVTSFLSQGQGEAEKYAPQSGQITGILKQMKDTMAAGLAEAVSQEEKAKADYKALMVAKKKEIEALQKSIETKLARLGESGVELVNMIEDLDDTKKSLEEDKAFLADMEKNCATKEAEWAARQKLRAQEMVALADTIKILNDDDALELFKKTLPSPSSASLVQVQVKSKAVQMQALRALKGASRDPRLDLIALALHGRKVNFDKVVAMIDDMVALLGKEQKDDEDKKTYCETELDNADDEKKNLERAISDLSKAIDENKAAVETLTAEIADLEQGIKDLDKQVAGATEQRKEEHADFVENLASNNAAKDLLEIAKNRMNKFYNPKLYRPPAKRELSAEERITVNLGGTAPPTAAPGGIAGTGVGTLAQIAERDAPAPPPDTFDAYAKKGEESNGVIAMIDLLKKDLTTEITSMEFEEKDAQADYEKLVTDSTAKRAADAQSIAEKTAAKADAEASLQKDGEQHKAKMGEAMANAEYIRNLHLECDWLSENFALRAEMRAGEVDSLKKAKAILSGADFSLVQTTARRLLRQAVRS